MTDHMIDHRYQVSFYVLKGKIILPQIHALVHLTDIINHPANSKQ